MQRNFYIPRLIETGRILLLLPLIWMCMPTTAFMQACHFKTGDPVTLAASGFTATAGYQQNYVLTNGAGLIQYVSPSLPVNGVAAGQYMAYAVNYNTTGTVPNLTVGVNINAIGGSCVDISAGLPVGVCSCNNTTGILVFNISGNTTAGGYTQSFALTDNDGTILSISAIPSFPGLANGLYNVYSVNYETSSGINGYSVGNQIAALSGTCFDLSDPLGFVVCLAACNPVITTSGPTTFCAGGSVTLDAGAAYTSYLWSTGATTRTINVTTSGTYNVTVTGANGCVGSATSGTVVTVNPIPVPVITASGLTTFCAGGSVTLDAGAGYTSYLWSTGATTQTIHVTTSGTYNVTVTSAGGCNSPAASGTTVTVTPIASCPCNNTTGNLSFTLSGNTVAGGYTQSFALTDNNGLILAISATPSFPGLANGIYNVYSINYETSSGIGNYSVGNQIAALSGTCFDLSDPLGFVVCLAACNPVITTSGPTTFCAGGSVTLDAGAAYTSYLWSTGATTRTINVTTSGTYNVTVTGANGCMGSAASGTVVTVNPIPVPVIMTSGLTTFCAGGSVTLDAGAGYTSYLWSTGATTQTIHVTTSGTYNVTVTGAGGCTGPAASGTTVTVTPIASCPCNNTTGNLAFTLSGNTVAGGYTQSFALTDNNGLILAISATPSFPGLANGIYNVYSVNYETSSAIGNYSVGNQIAALSGTCFDLSDPLGFVVCLAACNPVITASGPTTFCAGGSVTLDAGAGYTSYLWSTGATTRTINVTTSGTYNVTVTGANGCMGSAASGTVVTVNPIPVPVITTSGLTTFCAGGSVTLDAGAGYTSYLWSTGATTQTIHVTTSGTYNVTVTSAGGCNSPAASGTAVTVTPIASCPCNNTTGNLSFTLSGNTVAGGYTQSFALTDNNGLILAISATPSFPGLANGIYNVYSINYETSSGIGNYSVGNQIAALSGTCFDLSDPLGFVVCLAACNPVITTSGPTTFCAGGSVTLDAGAAYTSYLWSTGATTRTINVTTSGTYNVTVTGANGCMGSAASGTVVTVNPIPVPVIMTSGLTTFCAGGSVTLDAGAGYTSYLWSTGATTRTINVTTSGTYNVTVTSAGGCTSTTSIVITEPSQLTATISGTTPVVCSGGTSGTATVAPRGGTPPYMYLWPANAASQTTATAVNLAAGTYIVTVTDAGGCTATATATITQPTALAVTISATTNAACSGGNNGSATVMASGGTPVYTYVWPATAGSQTTATANNLAAGVYVVTATDANGCTAIATATITGSLASATFTVTGGGSYCISSVGVAVGLSGSTIGFNYQLQVGGVNTGAPLAGTGSALNFGNQTTAGVYTVIASNGTGTCTATMLGSATVIAFNCSIAITDPCVCLNNATTLIDGQFGEVIQVSAPRNQIWTVTAVSGFYLTNSPAPPALPIPMPIGTVMTNLNNDIFQINGIHIDALGYSLTVTNQAGISLSVSDLCSYPNPVITTNLTDPFCVNASPVPLTGNPGDANIASATFTVNGQAATQFNPALGYGQYLVTYTVNGGMPRAAGATDPGCIQSVSQLVTVIPTNSQLACNNLINVSLNASCTAVITPQMVLDGTYGCYGDYLVQLDKTAPFGNGPWVAGVVNAADIGHTYQVRITHLPSGNSCWGNIKIEDKLPPVLVCPSFNVPCNANITPGRPGVLLPNGLTLPSACMLPAGAFCFQVPAGCGLPAFDCSNITLCYIDTEVEENCTSGFSKTVTRKWTATDGSGNTSTCVQIIHFIRPTLANVVCPPNYDVAAGNLPLSPEHQLAFDCGVLGGIYPTPARIQAAGLQGYPSIFGISDSLASSASGTGLAEACNINYDYDDVLLKVCDGTYKIIRNWTILDWCTGEIRQCVQVIKVLDTTGPVFTCPADLTVSVNQQNCCAIVNLPDVIITDNCSRIDRLSGMIVEISPFTGDTIAMVPIGGQLTNFPGNNLWLPDTLGAFGITPCLPLGPHVVTYVVTDNCGNTSTCTFRLTVQDLEPPIPSCQTTTTVVVGQDDPYDCYGPAGPNNSPAAFDACTFGGVVKIPAKNFDSGSYDNCNPVAFFVQRMTPYSACINNLNHRNGHPACNDNVQDPTSEFDLAVNENDTIKFYCCEVGTTQTIVLRIYQLTADGNFDHDADGNTIRSECMIQVEVQDKQPPTCIAPPTAVVNCNFFDPTLWAYGIPTIFDNCCLLSTPNDYVYQGVAQCGLKVANNYSNFDTVCNRGTIRRTFTVTDCHNLSTSCTQLVVVNYQQDYFIKFPDDKIVTVCDGTTSFGAPIFQNDQDCELLAVTSSDVTYTVVEDACLKIERTWVIINWCTYNPNLPCIDIPNPNPTIINSQANLTGPTVSACGTPAPWAPTIVRINPGDPTTTNYCTFYQANANCYRYKQIIKIIDGVAPVITCPQPSPDFCAPLPPNTIGFGDQTLNDPLLWNAAYYFDQVSQQHDLCEGPVDLHITATDACSLADITIRYMLFLDLDGDGTMETVINSNTTFLPQAQQPAPGTLQFNNANNPNFSGGTNYTFDFRPVSAGQKYRFALQTTTAGVNKTGFVRWNTLNSPNTYVIPELPYGTHKIKWFVSDGCGNESLCEYNFIVRDCKPPTIVCHDLSINAMPNGMVQIWANDFIVYALDNCTPVDRLKYGIRRVGSTIDPFNTNPAGGIQFTCADLVNGVATIAVEVWAIDLAGNRDYCTTSITIQDNTQACGQTSDQVTVAGALKTELGEGLEEGAVELSGQSAAAVPFDLFDLSDENGAYGFPNSVPLSSNLTITPNKDDNPLNGVTTYDLALISKHILGLQPLTSPYKMIAADANKSGSITAFDIIELRKLILGIYEELPNNTSWRFVDKSFEFPNVANPFQTFFPENKTVANIQASELNDDFVAVKVGDVDYSAIANAQQAAESRTASTLLIDVEDRTIKAGETFALTFQTAEAAQGFQFTLNLNGLKVTDIEKSDKVDASNFGVFLPAEAGAKEGGALTVSINGAQEFTVHFQATKSGKISDLVQMSSRITKAEGYKMTGERQEVALRFHQNGTTTVSGVGFELYQNQPNPFVNHTSIGFHLPISTSATLTVYDESGRVIFTQKGDFAKGANAISVERSVLNNAGLLYYKLETDTESATKKMIQSK